MFYGQVGTRCYVPTALGDNQQYMVQSAHDVYAPSSGLAALYTVESNFWVSTISSPAFLDAGTGGTLTVSQGIEYPTGVFTRTIWSQAGATSITIPNFSLAFSKTILHLPAGKSRINILRRLKHSSSIGLNRQANGARRYLPVGDAVEQTTTDKTLTGGLIDGGGDFMIWPALIIGLTNGISLLGQGDSRTIGEGDTAPTDEHMGQFFHYLGPNYPYHNMGVAGQPYVDFTQNPMRAAIGQYLTTFLDANGYNSRTLSASSMYAAELAEAAFFSPREAWFATIYPGSSSTTGWTDTQHQTTDGFNANRTGCNDLMRAAARCLEIADQLESARNSGLWLPHTPGYTQDGVHADSPGAALITLPTFAPTLSAATIAAMPRSIPGFPNDALSSLFFGAGTTG